MNVEKIQERIEKNEAKLLKLNNTLSKYLSKLQEIYRKYCEAKEIHVLLPLHIFANFDTETYYSWAEEMKFYEEVGNFANFIHNQKAAKHYVSEMDKHGTIAKIGVYEFLYDAEEVSKQIVDKRKAIKEIEEKIRAYKDAVSFENKKQTEVDELFSKVPMLKTFIDDCGERQYHFLVNYYKGIKEAWQRYYQLDREACELWNSGNRGEEYIAKRNEAKKVKPKVFVRNEDQIKNDVEHWKTTESRLMADRIKTEFGEVIGTNLYLGTDGNVNGIIQGTEKTATINTIFAGGYNIQCLHTRLLVHEK